MDDIEISTNNESGTNNKENSKEENEDLLLNRHNDNNKQELNEDNQLFNQLKFLSFTHTFCLQCCEKLILKDKNLMSNMSINK
jgi:hypothetical protein